MNAIIIEDDFIVADHLRLMLEKHQVKVLEIIDNVEEAITSSHLKPDLFFVDIRLAGDKSGIELGEYLSLNKLPFIYLTANNELATLKKATQTKPLAYITKPYKESDIIALVELFKTKFKKPIVVKTKFGKKSIDSNTILYIEAKGSYVNIVTLIDTFNERVSLSQLMEELDDDFIRVHRSFIVNKNKINQYNSTSVFIKNTEIPISRTYKDNIV
ncbi:MAG: DNA-binding response regulator [Bacteroidetes bacterium]|nr:MAG: DNA-binding response regulator [Bacteroidota bacterium]MBL1144840.1 DNA-binding response regulator [Bacteroidota bacterium]NOG57634.1 response regulator transcription factor [Bacteroidota bacterium]